MPPSPGRGGRKLPAARGVVDYAERMPVRRGNLRNVSESNTSEIAESHLDNFVERF